MIDGFKNELYAYEYVYIVLYKTVLVLVEIFCFWFTIFGDEENIYTLIQFPFLVPVSEYDTLKTDKQNLIKIKIVLKDPIIV